MEEVRTEKCPYCNQAITHKELERIEQTIKSELDAKMKKFESESRARIEADEKRIAEERKALDQQKSETEQLQKKLEQEKQAYQDKLKREADEKLQAELKRLHDSHDAKTREELAKIDLQKKAVEQQAKAVSDMQERLNEEKKSYQDKLKREAEERIQNEVSRLKKLQESQLKEQDEKLKAQIKTAEEQQAKASKLQKQLEKEKLTYQEQIQNEFQNKQKDLIDEGKKAGRLEGDTDRRNLQKKVEELSRQLEKKTADELGSLSEEELAKKLAEAFREDKISRIPKGEQGADVRHDVMHKGLPCGLIIYESKNRKDWQNAYIERAKEYKTMYKTSSVILVSITFPSGVQNFCIRDGIVIAHPSIVIPVAEIIRATILRLHLLQLSHQEAESKMNEVYKYISSDDFKVHIDSISQNISDLQKLQQKEKDDHNRVWTKQTTVFDTLQRSALTIKAKIDNIIQATD